MIFISRQYIQNIIKTVQTQTPDTSLENISHNGLT